MDGPLWRVAGHTGWTDCPATHRLAPLTHRSPQGRRASLDRRHSCVENAGRTRPFAHVCVPAGAPTHYSMCRCVGVGRSSMHLSPRQSWPAWLCEPCIGLCCWSLQLRVCHCVDRPCAPVWPGPVSLAAFDCPPRPQSHREPQNCMAGNADCLPQPAATAAVRRCGRGHSHEMHTT